MLLPLAEALGGALTQHVVTDERGPALRIDKGNEFRLCRKASEGFAEASTLVQPS